MPEQQKQQITGFFFLFVQKKINYDKMRRFIIFIQTLAITLRKRCYTLCTTSYCKATKINPIKFMIILGKKIDAI